MQATWAVTYKSETGFDVELIDANHYDDAFARAVELFGSWVVEVERVS